MLILLSTTTVPVAFLGSRLLINLESDQLVMKILLRLSSVRSGKLRRGGPLSINDELQAKILAKSFALSGQDETTFGPLLIETDAFCYSEFGYLLELLGPDLFAFNSGLDCLSLTILFLYKNSHRVIAGSSDCSICPTIPLPVIDTVVVVTLNYVWSYQVQLYGF